MDNKGKGIKGMLVIKKKGKINLIIKINVIRKGKEEDEANKCKCQRLIDQ